MSDALSRKVLVIDDEREVCDLLRLILESRDFECVVAHNGIDGMLKALTEGPDLIVLDIMMPEMNGYDLLIKMRRNEMTEHIPVIVVTGVTQGDPRTEEEWRRVLGVEGFLNKPLRPEAFLALIESLVPGSAPGRTPSTPQT